MHAAHVAGVEPHGESGYLNRNTGWCPIVNVAKLVNISLTRVD